MSVLTTAFDSASGSVKSVVDCGSQTVINTVNCAAKITALVQCQGANNCTCQTFKIPTVAYPWCGGSSPYNVSSFSYAGSRTWYDNTPVDVWTASGGRNSLLVSNSGAIVGVEEVDFTNKPSASFIYIKWNSMAVDPHEFDIPIFCPPPQQHRNTKDINSAFVM
jgi:hypothetical protein